MIACLRKIRFFIEFKEDPESHFKIFKMFWMQSSVTCHTKKTTRILKGKENQNVLTAKGHRCYYQTKTVKELL